jgi:hypothetical protein
MAIATGAPVLSNMGLERISRSGEESLAHMALRFASMNVSRPLANDLAFGCKAGLGRLGSALVPSVDRHAYSLVRHPAAPHPTPCQPVRLRV